MALEKCKECGNEISTKAKACPKCGVEIKRTSGLTKLIAGIIVFMIIFGIIESSNMQERQQAAASAEQARVAALTPAIRAKEEADKLETDQFHGANGACMEFIKQRLNDPGSAEFMHSSQSHYNHKGNLWTIQRPVRAKNAMGALVLKDFQCELKFDGNKWFALKIQSF